ncbi:Sulfoquinovose isomerase [Saliniradius amylolyticus]|uniref:Sulfoquinovose isomerase n=1 Tax=Saliniradius amylolyticus TaxID=2183582 RepID=A0A2S2E396_9ALTE|nr:AGE family epimerase/isomerase [Saliniradius amylolyticus]AWL11992.1 Sulfoquinovose isomerase [Saliniradius amylolyticus]
MPDFKDARFLRQHIDDILAFYDPQVVDGVNGGFHQNYYDNGTVFDKGHKHLVSSTRMVVNYCRAYQDTGKERYLALAKHGLSYIRNQHWDTARQGYNWILQDNQPVDQTNHCYGLAFVILAYSRCVEVGIESARADLYRTWEILNRRFWQSHIELYADEASPDWKQLGDYRGQNANMHCCEATLAAYQATGDEVFLERAYTLAKTVAVKLADKTGGLIWEHFGKQLNIDWDYNKDDPQNLYRPWGFQPGHQTEWTKLLVTLHRYKKEDWLLKRARALFDRSLELCWDDQHGGICYGHAPDNSICDSDKYFWVQCETFAAAAMLAQATDDQQYWRWYEQIWAYAWDHFVDHKYGAWYRILKANNDKYTNEKSILGGKCDYHTMGACWDTLAVL